MKAVTFQGPLKLEVKEVDDPAIQEPNDVILKITSTAICGSDLHAYDGRMPLPPTGWTIGHEYVGEVVEVGSNVTNFRAGDRAVGSFVSSCGDCYYCTTGWPSQCVVQQTIGFVLLPGAQAEYLRVPNGHYTLEKIPDGLSDEKAIFAGDILATGYFAADRGEIKPGDVVVVVGSGPVGLFAQMGALQFDPKVVLAIDSLPERLAMSKKIGAEPVDMSKEDAVSVVKGHSEGRGADVVLEAVGIEASLTDAFKYVRPAGVISAVGMYTEPTFPFPMFQSFLKDYTFKIGMCPVKRYMGDLLGMIEAGKMDPSQIITHTMPLDDALRGYDIFHHRTEGCIKVLLKP
ncbi:MAG: alcohol dehydrogenase catalytic domain-containing protein [Chloroflexi bacterium]|nr:alcohol dehydrogenase catalytic domain-containing protein [Chloroflexota bacterium]